MTFEGKRRPFELDIQVSDEDTPLCLELSFKIGGNGLSALLLGWCKPESEYTWTDGHLSHLAVVVPEPGPYLLCLDGITLGSQRLILSVNGSSEAYRFDGPCCVTLPIEVSALGPKALVSICLNLPDANSPAALFGEPDTRILGFALSRLRLLRISGKARVSPPISLSAIEDSVGLSRSELVSQFESLGHNCEFGMVQRYCGAEPLGLLRFSGLTFANLLRGLETGFEGLGTVDSITHTFWQQNADPEYIIIEKNFNLVYHSGFDRSQIDVENLYRQESKRLRFYRRKFLEDVASAEKIFVFHWHGSLMTSEIMPLFSLLGGRRNTLLWVVASSEHAPGSVEILAEGLLRGYVKNFAPLGEVNRELDLAPWLSICANAYMIRNARDRR